jgi:photosystem II stability/assembly factor-like uncharacterized protein
LKVNATEVEDEHEATEDIGAREAYRRLQLQDENGYIAPDAWTNAYAEKNAMRFLPEAWSEFTSAAEMEAGIVGGRWTSIGPGNIGGRIRSLIIKPPTTPNAPRTIFAGAVSGGVWKSTNSGTTWTTNTDFLANLAVNCMAIDPANSNILYAGTGQGFAIFAAVRGNGIFKTTDGGATWNQLPFTADKADFAYINRLAISPDNSQLLLAAVRVEPPPPASPFGKILRSTNGGDSWTTTLTSSTMADVCFRPNVLQPTEIPDVPAVNCMASGLDGDVYYSTDSGATWTTRPDNLGITPPAGFQRVELAYSRSNPSIVYASKAGIGGNPPSPSELFHSENGGFSFTSLGLVPSQTTFYANVLWVDPTNANTLIVGGVYMFRSTDGGVHWEEADNLSHLDHHVLVEDPGYNGGTGATPNAIVYNGNDGGIDRTCNILAAITPTPSPGSVVWSNLNHSLGVTQFYGAAGHAATGIIIGGAQDNGTVRLHPPQFNPEDWDNMAYGDGGYCAVDQTATPYFYGENVFLEIYRNTHDGGGGGFKSEYIWGGPGHPNGIRRECSDLPCANFIAPFVIDPNPNRENTLLAGGSSLWRTNNAKSEPNPLLVRWDEIKPPSGGVGNNISAIAVAEGDSNVIWVGYTLNGSVFYTTNGMQPMPTWNPGDPNNLLPQGRFCTRLTVAHPLPGDPPDVARTVYATFGGFYPSLMDTRGNVWKTQNNGVMWTPIHHNLPNVPVFSLVISPTNPDFLYIGTEVGVFASSNGGQTWSPAFGGSSADTFVYSLVVSASSLSTPDIIYAGTNDGVFASKDNGETWAPGFGGPANTRAAELFWMVTAQTRKLVVATHGRGMFILGPAND